jgi:hypothetical protein
MAFSFFYLAFRALLGALVRCRRGLDVKDVELPVLRSRSCAASSRGRTFAVLIARCSRRRPATCHPPRAARVWSPRGPCCVGIERSCAGSGGSRQCSADARPCQARCGPSCCGWHGRIRAGAIGESAASWPNSGCSYRHRRSPAARPRRAGAGPAEVGSGLARVPARPGGEHRRMQLLHRRQCALAPVLRVVLHRARKPARLAGRLLDQPHRGLGDPAGTQPRPRPRRPRHALPDPRPRRQIQRPLRRGLPQRWHPDRQDAAAGAEGKRHRRAFRQNRPRRMSLPAADPQRPPPRARPAPLRRALQHAEAASRAQPSNHRNRSRYRQHPRSARSSATTASAASSTSTTEPPREVRHEYWRPSGPDRPLATVALTLIPTLPALPRCGPTARRSRGSARRACA